MEQASKLGVSAAKVARYDTDFSLCIICQRKTNEEFVEKPTSHEKVLKFVRERAAYRDGLFPNISRRLGNVSEQDLQSKCATRHRKCYQDTVHTSLCKRTKERYEKQLAAQGSKVKTDTQVPEEESKLTRSQSVAFDKNLCFFCECKASHKNPLHKVATENAGRALKEAVEKSGNQKQQVKLFTAIDTQDVHAIDIRYHKRCWTTHVHGVLRSHKGKDSTTTSATDEIASNIKFFSLVEGALQDGSIANMESLQEVYVGIQSANNVQNPDCSRKKLRQLILEEIPEIEFHKATRSNESDRVTIKKTWDAAIHLAENTEEDDGAKMKCLFDAAIFLRKAISKCKAWKFTGSLNDATQDQMPKELYSFFCWVLQGPTQTLTSDKKSSEVNKRAVTLAESTVQMFLSEHQIRNEKSLTLYSNREMPHQYAVGLSIRQATRSKKLVNLLHGFGLSPNYERLLRVETQITRSIIQQMALNDGLYIPHNFVIGRHMFFAVDNVDFAEDTPDGKRTLHATAMAIYQRTEVGDTMEELKLTDSTLDRSIRDLPHTISHLMDCPKPGTMPQSPLYPSFSLQSETDLHVGLNLLAFRKNLSNS